MSVFYFSTVIEFLAGQKTIQNKVYISTFSSLPCNQGLAMWSNSDQWDVSRSVIWQFVRNFLKRLLTNSPCSPFIIPSSIWYLWLICYYPEPWGWQPHPGHGGGGGWNESGLWRVSKNRAPLVTWIFMRKKNCNYCFGFSVTCIWTLN